MIVSRAKAGALALGLALAAGPVLAQTAAQVPPASPGEPQSIPPEDKPYSPPGQAAPTIIVNTLGAVDGPATDLLDTASGGLESDLWSGSSRADIEDLLSRIPLASPDKAVRALSRRLVLATADAPAGPGKRALVTIRIEKLLSAGMIDEAGALAASVSLKADADFAFVQAQAILTAGRGADACSDLTATRLSSGGLFWLQLRAFCAAASGDAATAELTGNVIDAQGLTDNAYNILAGDALSGAKTPPGPIAKPTAIHVFLLRKAGLPIGGDVASVLGTSANLLAMRDARNPPQIRQAAAERIVRLGAASIDELKAVADAQPFTTEQKADALNAQFSAATFFAGQALLRQAAAIESRPAEKQRLIERALSISAFGPLQIAAGLQADNARTIDAAMAGRGGDDLIPKALILAGRPGEALPWLIGDQTAAVNEDALAVDLLAPSPERDARAAQALASPNATGLMLGLGEIFGQSVPPDADAKIALLPAMEFDIKRPPPEKIRQLDEAAAQPGRKGEAILLVLEMIGPRGPVDIPPDTTIHIVRTLKTLGELDAARDIATEALAFGMPLPLSFAPPPPQAQ